MSFIRKLNRLLISIPFLLLNVGLNKTTGLVWLLLTVIFALCYFAICDLIIYALDLRDIISGPYDEETK